MTQEQITLLAVRQVVAQLTDADRKGVELAAAKLREVVATHNDHGRIALALVGAEEAAK
ncbi:MAG: hypothetical protein JSR68_08320 [Proteobacteria bacterium]|nr:hypothetical protein [Pseudomonadota bacterium]